MKNTTKNQTGFAILESLLILIIIVVVGGIGWYAVHTKHQTDKILSQADKISQNTPVNPHPKERTVTIKKSNPKNDLVISEWGIKITLGADSSSVTYKVVDKPYNTEVGAYIGYAQLLLKDSVTTDPKCQDLAILINRGLKSANPPGDIVIGNYKYDISGAQAPCGDASMNTLREKLRSNLNISAV